MTESTFPKNFLWGGAVKKMKSAAGNIKIYGIPGAERTYVGGIRYNYNGIRIAYAYMQVNVGAHHL